MTGKQHMVIGTTASVTMSAFLVMNNTINSPLPIACLIGGSFVGSYMPDIDSEKSKASTAFNKVLAVLIILFTITYVSGQLLMVENLLNWIKINKESLIGIITFSIVTILGKLSPHRMFTHKILGTALFCYSIYLMGNLYFTFGFILGYLLHIVCDKFTKNGKYLTFFEFKLPCKNSKNKTKISW
ncbi:MAG: metal-dependent hydrolase [Clostridium sp.]|uniref:metal-dependent hydrolase n=1 Tax=Clostridium sp. DSM 8431 TaxID=1761781 RepID=UPI0008E07AE2|nr:metal-dependent hydrolase [Clostridium sp. DSM 8431]MCR4944507.1 metal-dependent hydrolase [Clostridium sp.]SFU82800.1 inner membrane protein [Clostridium sp. DSM 8431]